MATWQPIQPKVFATVIPASSPHWQWDVSEVHPLSPWLPPSSSLPPPRTLGCQKLSLP